MGWFSRAIRKAKRGVSRATHTVGRGISRAATSVAHAAEVVNDAVDGGGIVRAIGGVIDRATGGLAGDIADLGRGLLNLTIDAVAEFEGMVAKLPFGEELILVAELTQPQIAAARAALASGQQLSDFIENGKLNVKGLVANAISKRVPGYDKLSGLQNTFDKYQQAKNAVNDAKRIKNDFRATIQPIKRDLGSIASSFGEVKGAVRGVTAPGKRVQDIIRGGKTAVQRAAQEYAASLPIESPAADVANAVQSATQAVTNAQSAAAQVAANAQSAAAQVVRPVNRVAELLRQQRGRARGRR